MTKNKLIDVKTLSEEEQMIIILLEKKGKSLFGNVFKQLKMSQTMGSEIIQRLKKKGIVKNVNKTSLIELEPSIQLLNSKN